MSQGYTRMAPMDLSTNQQRETDTDIAEGSRLLFGGIERGDKARPFYDNAWRRRRALIIMASALATLGALALVLGLVFGLKGKHHKVSPGVYSCPNSSFDHSFFVIGDWGRNANDNQRTVASMMGQLGVCYKPSYVISTGDNFYENGLKQAHDPLFTTAFTNVYTDPSLQVPWYAVLGNHDYGELSYLQYSTCSARTLDTCPPGCCYSPLWQTNITALDWRWSLSQGSWKRTVMDGQLELFFIDTTPLVSKYRKLTWAHTPGGIASWDPAQQRAAIHSMLSAPSTARWRILVGHHPVRSYGAHCEGNGQGDCIDMQFLAPWLKQYKIAAYFSGHEHDLQLIKARDDSAVADPVYYVVSGAGSDTREGEFGEATPALQQEIDFMADQQGFVAVGIKGDQMTLDFWVYSVTAKPAYSVTLPRPM